MIPSCISEWGRPSRDIVVLGVLTWGLDCLESSRSSWSSSCRRSPWSLHFLNVSIFRQISSTVDTQTNNFMENQKQPTWCYDQCNTETDRVSQTACLYDSFDFCIYVLWNSISLCLIRLNTLGIFWTCVGRFLGFVSDICSDMRVFVRTGLDMCW